MSEFKQLMLKKDEESINGDISLRKKAYEEKALNFM